MRKASFAITGMTCAACAARVEKAVRQVAGVRDVSVNLLKNSMTAAFDETAVSPEDIAGAVRRAGYGARAGGQHDGGGGIGGGAVSGGAGGVEDALRALRWRLCVSFCFLVPLMYVSMGHMVGLPLPEPLRPGDHPLVPALVQLLLALPVLLVNGAYYRTGFRMLFSGAPNMDSLIAVGSGAAALSGVWAVLAVGAALERGDMALAREWGERLYFESAAMILTLITLGKFFETRAKGKTSEAVARLMGLAPRTATVLRDGVEACVPVEEVRVGETLVVKSGESFPVDGEILEGGGFVDESAITGESLPVEKGEGARVTGATIATSGHFRMRALRVGEDTTLARIVRLVDEATSSKAPAARLADRASGVFVPVVMGIAVAAACVWLLLGKDVEFALSIAIAVLVISCPCALGLATPTAIMVGTGRGASCGILFRSAEAMEAMRGIGAVVLDKTGTVTFGAPETTDICPAAGVDEADLLRVAASLEHLSEHPLGGAIVREAERRSLPLAEVTEFSQTAGQGISGRVDGALCLAGNARLLEAHGIALSGELRAAAASLAGEGKTPLFFAADGRPLGIVAVADVVKPDSARAVAALEDLGIQVTMLTGDNAVTAAAVGRQVGIRRVVAQVLPQDKEREIRTLQEQGHRVAMVGDGINDAPALARADVGIALGAGTDIAIESSGVVLMRNSLMDVVTAVELGRAVVRTIRQNLFWAFFYNAAGIPVAAGALYGLCGLTLNPMIAAAAMSCSSVSVVANALRLRSFSPRHAVATAAAAGAGQSPEPQQHRSIPMRTIISIDGMNCGHCSASVEKALRAVAGVGDVAVSLEKKNAVVTHDNASVDALRAAVTGAGFTVTGVE